MATGRNIFLVEATISPAKCCPPVTVQMFEVQFHQVRVVEIGRKIMSGARLISTHAGNGIPNLGRQTIDMFGIPGIVVPNLTAAGECVWLIAKQ